MAPKDNLSRSNRRSNDVPLPLRIDGRPPAPTRGRNTRTDLAWAGGVASLLTFAVGLTAHQTGAIQIMGLLTALLGVAQIINSLWRGREWWHDRGIKWLLIGELAAAGFMPAIAGSVEFRFPTHWWALIPWAIPLGAVTICYEHFEAVLARRRPRGARSGTDKFANLPLPGDVTPAQLAEASHGVPLGWFNNAVKYDRYQTARSPHLRSASLARRSIASGLCGAALLPVAASGAMIFNAPNQLRPKPDTKAKRPDRRRRVPPRASSPTTTPPNPTSSAPSAWNGVCAQRVGSTAPRWARVTVYHAIKTQPGAYGAQIVGCLGPFTTTSGPAGSFTWALATNPVTQAVLSLVVDSTTWGPTVYLQPAVTPVETLIRRDGAIGGPARISVPSDKPRWDMYLINTAAGTVVLVRQTTNGTYTTVPAQAVPVWIASMRAVRGWLWPVQDAGTRNLELINPVNGQRAYTMIYSPATGGYSDAAGAATEGLPVDPDEITTWDALVR